VEIRIESVDIVLPLDRSEDDVARRDAAAAKLEIPVLLEQLFEGFPVFLVSILAHFWKELT